MGVARERWTDPGGLALAVALLPFATVHLSYAMAAGAGLVPACFPYLDGCTSVSATGRYGWSYFLFKGGMLPAAVLTGLYWWLCREWLRALGDGGSRWPGVMAWTGITGAVFLALYTVFLGHPGEPYNLLRRFGVTVHFGCSYLALLLLLGRLRHLQGPGQDRGSVAPPPGVLRAMTALAVGLLALGLANIPVGFFIADKDAVENAIEWNFCAGLVAFHGLVWRAWRTTGFRLRTAVEAPDPAGRE